jgi:hypothetical protein
VLVALKRLKFEMARLSPFFVVQEALFSEKLTKVSVDGNGNCLFYSLLSAIGRPLEKQMSLRVLCAQFFSRRWLECPPGSGRRASTYSARLNDCYSGEPAFRGVNPCFPNADAYVRYITRDQAWARTSEIEVLSLLWQRPIIVWTSDGVPNPGIFGFVADVPPINIVYSNGNHYDALVGTVSDALLTSATAALYNKGRTQTSLARVNVLDFASDSQRVVLETAIHQPPSACFPGVSATTAPKRKADIQSCRPSKKGSHRVDGVRKAHNKWRVALSPNDTYGLSQSRLTVPFDYLTEEVAEKVHQFVCCSLAGIEPESESCSLDCATVEQLQAFLLELRSGRVDAYVSMLKSNARKAKQRSAVPQSNLRGILYNASSGVWSVRVKLRDVFGKEKSTKVLFAYLLEKDAGLAYDFTIMHFCSIINQRMNHKLNFPAEAIRMERQAELKCYVEEVLSNSYSFQVGKTLPAIPILRGVDQGSGGSWTIWLSVFGVANPFFVFFPTTRFGSTLEASFAYDHLMPKVRQLGNPALSFNPNFGDYQPFAGFEAQLNVYFEDHLRLHPVLLSLSPEPLPDVPSTNDPVPLKRLRGVLQRGSSFVVRISVPNSANQAIIHHLPQVYSTGMEAALAYDCITRLLLPYRARPSPLNFITSFATLECAANMATYFRSHLLPLLPDLLADGGPDAVPTTKEKMTLAHARAYFLAQRRDGPVHPCCCCRRTWFRRSVVTLTDKFLEKIPNKI